MSAKALTVSLAKKTYWKIGGNCESYYEVESITELRHALEIIKVNRQEFVVIGNGTNVLFDTLGYNDAVIKLGKSFDFINSTSNGIEVGACTWVPGLIRKLSIMGFGGLEHCIGIPATFGGLVAMNGGSQRKSISNHLLKVKYIDLDGVVKNWDALESSFSYRTSPFKNTGKTIISATISCKVIKPRENRNELLSILKERRRKFPRKLPNCGSVFLSSPDIYNKLGPPGYIIESLGLKGLRVGGAEISKLHGNFIVNLGGACSDDILSLVDIINRKCKEAYGFELESEALFYSSDIKGVSLDEAVKIKGSKLKCEIF